MTPLRFAASDRLLVLAPHPDDEVLGAGAAILAAREAGASVQVAFATDGEGNVWVQRLVERRLRITAEDRERFGRRRRAEGLAALAVLGVGAEDVEFLALPDTELASSLRSGDDRVRASVKDLLNRLAPTVLVGPSPLDVHPDHGALGVVVRGILRAREGPRSLHTMLEFCVHGDARTPDASRVEVRPRSPALLRAALARHEAPMRVHRREFLAHVARPLRLARVEAPRREDDRHPLLRASRTPQGMRIDIRDGSSVPWGRLRDLVLVRCVPASPWPVYTVPLPRRGDAAPVRCGAAGEACGPARIRRRHGRLRVDVPLASSSDASRWFVKVERHRGFYDAAGWLEAASPDVAPIGPPAAPHRDPRVVVVVPCYDVARWCGPVVAAAAQRGDRVLAVDDGSTDGTAEVLARCAAVLPERIHVLRFARNRGKGAVLLAAFEHALAAESFDVLVTIDADGQHRPEDVGPVTAACAAGADLAIGARDSERMPLRSRFGNSMTSLLMRRLFPRCPRDTQSGLRAHSRALVSRVVAEVSAGRYETEIEILLLALAASLPVAAVPIPTVYLERNRSSHFRPLRDGLRVYGAVARWWIRRHLSSGTGSPTPRLRSAPHERAPRAFGSLSPHLRHPPLTTLQGSGWVE